MVCVHALTGMRLVQSKQQEDIPDVACALAGCSAGLTQLLALSSGAEVCWGHRLRLTIRALTGPQYKTCLPHAFCCGMKGEKVTVQVQHQVMQ